MKLEKRDTIGRKLEMGAWKVYMECRPQAKNHPLRGRVTLLAVSLADSVLEIVKRPLSAIHYLGHAAMNLVGSFSSSTKYKFRDALYDAEKSLRKFVGLPIAVLTTPLKLIGQIARIVTHPEHLTPLHNFYR